MKDGGPGADERREQFPIPVDVAVPVQAASKTGARELTGVEGNIGFAQPGGEILWVRHVGRHASLKAAVTLAATRGSAYAMDRIVNSWLTCNAINGSVMNQDPAVDFR
jgi:hypothetical protein